jgi:hypothetical protein
MFFDDLAALVNEFAVEIDVEYDVIICGKKHKKKSVG